MKRRGRGAYFCSDHGEWVDEYDWNHHLWTHHAAQLSAGGSVFAKWRVYR